MRINEYLFHNDPNYRKLVDERERESWQPTVEPYTSLSDIQLRRYPSGQWYVKYFVNGGPEEYGGQMFWDKRANTYEAKYLFEEIQAELLLSNDTRQVTRDSVVEDGQANTLWQIIWIDEVEYTDMDRKVLKPDTALVIYNNQAVWKTYAQFRGSYYQYKLPRKIEMALN